MDYASGRDTERMKKDLTKRFSDLGLKITIKTNLTHVNFLDLTLNLNSGKYYSYKKPNGTPSFIRDKLSNHRPSMLKKIPAVISRRITDTSSVKKDSS